MLKNKFNRHTIAFVTLVLASILLYPAAHAGWMAATWLLLGSIVLAGLLTLLTK